ncbi:MULTISPECIES: hypothetical protein [Thalassospira]|mgnify:FL=1|uniref:fascin domain-containing protein n=1 Tax=Thalassospira TaxID=168934 RepID=UPI0008DCD154|nr:MULTISPECIES: hypothetical protein [Thalassospira]MDM7976639.1 hypothetical protein [Thalassospira xiamenensis]OHY97433.1 hypothetical protein BC440_22325 [Thalassospira sp. MIT1004]
MSLDNLSFPVSIGSITFPEVFVRMDGTGVTKFNGAGSGTVNCQYTAGPWELYNLIRNDDGTVSFQSFSFPNVFLRMDGTGVTKFNGAGAGTVNCQYTAGPWEKFNVTCACDGPANSCQGTIESNAFPNVFLRTDGTGVTKFNGAGAGTVNCQYTAGPWEKYQFGIHLNKAIVKLGDMYPTYQSDLQQYAQQIIMNIVNCTTPQDDELGQLSQFFNDVTDFSSPEPTTVSSDCALNCAGMCLSAISLVVSLMGYRTTFGNPQINSVKAAIQRVGGKFIQDIKIIASDLKATGKLKANAEQVFKLISLIWESGDILKSIVSALAGSLGWWDALKLAIVALATIAAWIATDGIALVLEIVTIGLSLVEFIQYAHGVTTNCIEGSCQLETAATSA